MDSDTLSTTSSPPLSAPSLPSPRPDAALSYKFQRLRERLRAAIASGELSGKLPGERVLARRFRVNAKTLSKALTDLAAEGVLDRSIGRGTFVAGATPAEPAAVGRWLILTDEQGPANRLVTELLKINPDSRPHHIAEPIRPSLLGASGLVINTCDSVPDALYRDLLLRGIPLFETTRPHAIYSTCGVMLDRECAAFTLAARLLMMGHDHIAAVDAPGQDVIRLALQMAAERYDPDARIVSLDEAQVLSAALEGLSAIVCDGSARAARVRLAIDTPSHSFSVQPPVALLAIGELADDPPCSGIYLDPAEQARHLMDLVQHLQPHRRNVLLLRGKYIDRGTTFRIPREQRTASEPATTARER